MMLGSLFTAYCSEEAGSAKVISLDWMIGMVSELKSSQRSSSLSP